MHDGYLFTLALCGTATDRTPALAIVNTLLRALPPVKRAALLGEVVPLDQGGQSAAPMHDWLLGQVIDDMRDAELLLIVSPLYLSSAPPTHIRLPTRLATLLQQAAPLAAAGQLRGKCALLVGIDTFSTFSPTSTAAGSADDLLEPGPVGCVAARLAYRQALLAPLHQFCAAAGIEATDAAIIHAPIAAEHAAANGTSGTSGSTSMGHALTPATAEALATLARRAYARARQRWPSLQPPCPELADWLAE